MAYLLTLIEGIITIISPFMLPMLPVYISYFAGQQTAESIYRTLKNALGFVVGFSLIFVTLGAFAGQLGSMLLRYQIAIDLVCGAIMIVFGLYFMGLLEFPAIRENSQTKFKHGYMNSFSSVLFGIVFSISWTPCVSIFLGSVLLLATQSGNTLRGILMLLSFSLGLGIPFVAGALLIDKLKRTFDFINRHHKVIKTASGTLLIIIGLIMGMGWIGYLYAWL